MLRLLTFVNHANMGDYRQAVDNFLAGLTPMPEITAHPLQTTIKYGFGANFEQPLNDWIGVFGRWGWNEGQHESYAYTEVDQTAQIGVALQRKSLAPQMGPLQALFSSPTESRETISSIWRSAAMVSCSAMAV